MSITFLPTAPVTLRPADEARRHLRGIALLYPILSDELIEQLLNEHLERTDDAQATMITSALLLTGGQLSEDARVEFGKSIVPSIVRALLVDPPRREDDLHFDLLVVYIVTQYRELTAEAGADTSDDDLEEVTDEDIEEGDVSPPTPSPDEAK